MIEVSDTENTELIKNILDSQHLAVLASLYQGSPYNNLVAFAATDDLKSIIFTTSRNTRKYNNIMANENVALLIDSRNIGPPDFSHALAITVLGAAREIKGDEKTVTMSLYLKKHPHLEGFVNNADNAVMKVTVSDYIIARFDKAEHVSVK